MKDKFMKNRKVKIGAAILGILLVITISATFVFRNNKKNLATNPKAMDNVKSGDSKKDEKSNDNIIKNDNEEIKNDKDLNDKEKEEEKGDESSNSTNNDTSDKEGNKDKSEKNGNSLVENNNVEESGNVGQSVGNNGDSSGSSQEEKPASKPEVKPEPTTKYVTISITCNTVLNNLDKLDEGKKSIIPSNGVILATQKVEIKDGDTVFDVLSRETRKQRIHMDFVESPVYKSVYIRGINNLYEFDAGDLSGWKYSVNGIYPNVGCSNYNVKSGDVIEWKYTCDLGNDL